MSNLISAKEHFKNAGLNASLAVLNIGLASTSISSSPVMESINVGIATLCTLAMFSSLSKGAYALKSASAETLHANADGPEV